MGDPACAVLVAKRAPGDAGVMSRVAGVRVKFALAPPNGRCPASSDLYYAAPNGHQFWPYPNGQISVCQNLTGYGWAINGLFLGYNAKRPHRVGVEIK